MRAAARLSVRHAGLPAADARRLAAMLDAWRLPRRIAGVRLSRIAGALEHDKKRRAAACAGF